MKTGIHCYFMTKSKQTNSGAKSAPKPAAKAKAAGKQRQHKSGMQNRSMPAAQTVEVRSRAPRIKTSKNGRDVTISHREMFSTVLGTSAFSAAQFLINPGNSTLFPWLSQVAPAYDSFEVKAMKIEYVPRCSTSEIGSVMLGVDYNVETPAPATDTQIDAWYGTADGACWEKKSLTIDREALRNLGTQKYISQGYPQNDLKTYYPGVIYVATFANNPSNGLGKVWVDYTIKLITAQSGSPSTRGVGAITSGAGAGGGTLSAAACLGTAPTYDPDSSGVTLYLENDGSWSVQLGSPGQYMVTCVYNGSVITNGAVVAVAANGPVIVQQNFVQTGAVGIGLFALTAPATTDPRSGRIKFTVAASTITSFIYRIAKVSYNSIVLVPAVKVTPPRKELFLATLPDGSQRIQEKCCCWRGDGQFKCCCPLDPEGRPVGLIRDAAIATPRVKHT